MRPNDPSLRRGAVAALAVGAAFVAWSAFFSNAGISVSKIAVAPTTDTHLTLSPDGRWLAYVASNVEDLDVYDLALGREYVFRTGRGKIGPLDLGKAVWLPDSGKLFMSQSGSRWVQGMVDLRNDPPVFYDADAAGAQSDALIASLTCSDCPPAPPSRSLQPRAASSRSFQISLNSGDGTYSYPSPDGTKIIDNVRSRHFWGDSDQWFYHDLTKKNAKPVKIMERGTGPAYYVVWQANGRAAYGLQAGGALLKITVTQ